MSTADRRPQGPRNPLDPATRETLFLEDTVEVQYNGKPVVGVITATWHDQEEDDIWDEIDAAICSPKVTDKDLADLQRTGLPPRDQLLFFPSSPEHRPMLVHESECKLLDRALAFGDVVKKSLTSETSGTVISVDVTVGLRHAYFDPANPERCYSDFAVEGVPEAELELATPWNEGDFVIYKGAWMGVVRAIDAEVTMKLRDDSVVIVEDPGLLDIPVPDPETPGSSGAPPETTGALEGAARPRPNATSGTPKRQETVSGLHNLTAGQMITTTKANLRRGRWIYGQYNASIPPTGTIVEAKPSRLSVAWLCQNVMVPGRFVPMPEPDSYLELLEEENNLNKFHKSTGGYKAADGRRFTKLSEVQSGGELQVGDRVRFRDLEQAIGKYNVKKIPRNEVLGYEVNVFIVYETKTQVRIQWQDGTESLHDACSLVSYLNVDDHDVWPGEIVVMKSETSLSNEVSAITRIQAALPGILAARYGPLSLPTPLPDANPTKSEKIGVVESVEPPARLARVRWFKSPDIQVSAGYTMAGSRTGELEAEAEDVSLYEVVAHHALALRRGDIVLIAPPPPPLGSAPTQEPEDTDMPDLVTPSWEFDSADTNNQNPPPNLDTLTPRQLEILTANLAYGATVEARFATLVDAVGRPEHPLYPILNEMLESFPRLVEHEIMPRRPEAVPVHSPMDTPPEWVGEVVDLGMDGLVTVRLGALDELKEVRVPIERLHVVHTEDMDLPGEDELMDEDSDDSDSDMSGMPELVEVTYEGGEPADTGMDEDWLTDEEEEEEDDTVPWAADPDVPDTSGQQRAASEPIARTPPPIPENIPPPEAITLPESSSTPPRFEMLDTPVPSDHALLSQPSVATSPAFTRRVMREYKILSSSLPEGIFVRTWESRLDLFRVLILGPLNTPYELAPFLFDFYFPATFPTDPPQAYFHSWTNGIGRVNPNLYDDGTGKVCLSLLGTWHADERGEGWSASRSTILQVLVSLMGLVLVREPWYNEAGFSIYEGSQQAQLNSQLYSEKAYILSRRFVRHVISHPIPAFENVINWLYTDPSTAGDERPQLLKQVVEKGWEVIHRSEGTEELTADNTLEGVGKISRGAMVMLKRDLEVLKERLEVEVLAEQVQEEL